MDKLIDLFMTMDKVEKCHDIIVDAITNAVIESISNIVSLSENIVSLSM